MIGNKKFLVISQTVSFSHCGLLGSKDSDVTEYSKQSCIRIWWIDMQKFPNGQLFCKNQSTLFLGQETRLISKTIPGVPKKFLC